MIYEYSADLCRYLARKYIIKIAPFAFLSLGEKLDVENAVIEPWRRACGMVPDAVPREGRIQPEASNPCSVLVDVPETIIPAFTG
jgi:hypothetical protein